MKIITTCSLLSLFALIGAAENEAPDTTRAASARVDELIDQHLASIGVTPPAEASDETFVRRAYLDIVGRIPTNREAESFLRSSQD